jgi:phosphatidylinositol alpha-mannosyltransferase
VAVERFASAEALPGWPGEGGAIGFLGRFGEPRKGFSLLLEAFALLAPRYPRLRLLVAGPGDEDETFGETTSELSERITLLGKVSDEEKARMLSSVDIYVAPNIGGESFGIILTEAMAAGTPVVASDLDAFRAVLDEGRAGALFPTGDAAALSETLAALLDDPAARRELAARGSARVAEYDWGVIAGRVLEVYSAAIAAGGERPVEGSTIAG